MDETIGKKRWIANSKDVMAAVVIIIALLFIIQIFSWIIFRPTTQIDRIAKKQVSSSGGEEIIVNPCIGTPINLFSIPDDYFTAPKRDDPFDSPLSYGAKKVDTLPDCQNLKVQVLRRECSPIGIEYDYIKYGNKEGWATRRLLTCPASKKDTGCDSAPDSICSYG